MVCKEGVFLMQIPYGWTVHAENIAGKTPEPA
jgi:hypothetical protein